MKELLLNRWLHLGTVTFVIGVALGAGVWAALLSDGSNALSVGDQLILTTGGTVFVSGDGSDLGALEEIFVEQLPLTGASAVAAGWVDPVFCSPGRGKYFRRDGEGGENPHLLIYDNLDEIIGIYMFSDSEMPAPWKQMDELLGGGGIAVVDHEHWGLFVYFTNPTRACSSGDKTASGTGGTHYAAPSAVRSYEVPATPTPALSPRLALETIASKMAALTSMSTTFTGEPEGLALAENIQPADISEVIRAMEGPADTDNQWIDNLAHRGISGTVSGKKLVSLVPSAAADARVTVKIWVSDSHVVRQLRIEGAAASGDPEASVRILDLSAFE